MAIPSPQLSTILSFMHIPVILTGMTTNTSILCMCAISCVAIIWTIQNRSFSSSTPNIIKKNWSRSLAICCTSTCHNSCIHHVYHRLVKPAKIASCKYLIVELPVVDIPSCLHTTIASVLLQKSSHTLPHWLITHTSTLPSKSYVPDGTSLTGILGHKSVWTDCKNAQWYYYYIISSDYYLLCSGHVWLISEQQSWRLWHI